jgi:5'-nucleotidase
MSRAAAEQRLTVAISSRALFDLGESHTLFEREGLDAYRAFQMARENELLAPGIAFPLVEKLLRINRLSADTPRIEVILLSRNSSDTGLRIFNSIEHYGLEIVRAAFTNGAPTWPYVHPFGAQLFLSANHEDVRSALEAGIAAATILPSKAPDWHSEQLRIAFDGDAVIFSDESERISLTLLSTRSRSRLRQPTSAARGFLVLVLHVAAGVAHGLDDLVERDLVLAVAAQAMREALIAFTAPIALRSMQGICTRPPIGSQVRPRLCSMPISAAFSTWYRRPPSAAVRPAAAIEQATPTSPWQPTSAPEIEAFSLYRMPMAAR